MKTTLRQRVVISIVFLLSELGLSSIVKGVIDYFDPSPPIIPNCLYAPDVIVGNGEYNQSTGYWSEYNCVSDWRDAAGRSISRGGR